MTDLENLYHHAIQRVRLYPCCFSGAKRDYPVFALYPPEYQYYSHQIADCGGWYRGTEMRLIGLDGYTIATGILNSNLNGDNIVSIPLDIDDPIELVYIKHEKASLSKMGERFIEYLIEEVKFDK